MKDEAKAMTNDQTVTQADESAAIATWNGIADHYNQWPNLSKSEQDHWVQAFARHRIAHSGEGRSNGAGEDRLREAAQELLDGLTSTYRARNGREVGIEADDGEKCYIVHSELVADLRAALKQQPD